MTSKKKSIIILGVVVVVALAGSYYYWRNHQLTSAALTTSKSKSAQNNYKGDGRHSVDGQSGASSDGGVTDNHGDTTKDGSTSEVTSSSGNVTVFGPQANSSLSSGDTLRGTAKGLAEMQYRIVDDKAGVIGQGTLEVVEGAFSGKFQFSPQSDTGRIDVYSFNSNYQETDNVQIPVRFAR
jgi:hypothetical protein